MPIRDGLTATASPRRAHRGGLRTTLNPDASHTARRTDWARSDRCRGSARGAVALLTVAQ